MVSSHCLYGKPEVVQLILKCRADSGKSSSFGITVRAGLAHARQNKRRLG